MDHQTDDPRHTELETLEAIFPEIRRSEDPKDPFTFDIELPVQPAEPVTVTFPAATGNDLNPSTGNAGPAGNGLPEVDSVQVSHLPALSLCISLPDGYPEAHPPVIHISTNPQWLLPETLTKLESDGPRLWEEMGREMVAFTYIDHVQRAADDVFGAISEKGTLEIDPQHKLAVLDHDIKAKNEAFERETFDCGICLDPKKGSKCHKMLDCGHIFCLQCLQDFYNDAIKEGSLSTVRCLTPNCAKERAQAQAGDGSKVKKSKTTISPSELLQIGLSNDAVKRYVALKYKTELESDKNTIYCPRQWCQGAARSKKHKKPSGLEFEETSDQESDNEAGGAEAGGAEAGEDKADKPQKYNPADLLSVCEDCGFAFCSRCYQSWHGEFVRCRPRRTAGDEEELTEEEKATLAYIQKHTSLCPSCHAPAQKTHGCNHMICSRCDTHYCYLCSAWLDPRNPYRHYNESPGGETTECYMRLWELEEGDGVPAGPRYMNGRRLGGNAAPAAEVEAVVDDEVDDDVGRRNNERPQHQRLDEQGRPIAVTREAPLVLRLGDDQPNNAQPPVPPAAPEAPVGAGRGQHRPQRGGAAQRGAPARGRGGRGARGGRGRGRPGNAQAGGGPVQNIEGGPNAGLDAAQEAWVRHFVQMALIDAEDEVDDEDDDNDFRFRIR